MGLVDGEIWRAVHWFWELAVWDSYW